jgi:hypothetical protein
MALTQAQRISISKKIVGIPDEAKQVVEIKAQLDVEIAKSIEADNGNKSICDEKTVLINAYQKEARSYLNNDYLELTEQHFQDAANRIKQNKFFANDPAISLPSTPGGVWKNMPPSGYGVAIGKQYNETYTFFQGEASVFSTIRSNLITLDTFQQIEKTTGQSCSGTCSLPQYTTQLTCTGGGGIWTDGIANNPTIQTAANNIVSAVNQWKTNVEAIITALSAIVDPVRASENAIALADAQNTLTILNTWIAYPLFNTAHGQVTCPGFYAYNPLLLVPTKFSASMRGALETELNARESFIATRQPQIVSYLGSITQDAKGQITNAVGLWGDRFRFIDLRLNAMAGSLAQVNAMQNGKNAQDEVLASNANASAAYGALMKATKLSAPAMGSPVIHVESSSDFSIGQSCYVAADEQEEKGVMVVAKSGNILTLDTPIPQKYTTVNVSRLYRLV